MAVPQKITDLTEITTINTSTGWIEVVDPADGLNKKMKPVNIAKECLKQFTNYAPNTALRLSPDGAGSFEWQ